MEIERDKSRFLGFPNPKTIWKIAKKLLIPQIMFQKPLNAEIQGGQDD